MYINRKGEVKEGTTPFWVDPVGKTRSWVRYWLLALWVFVNTLLRPRYRVPTRAATAPPTSARPASSRGGSRTTRGGFMSIRDVRTDTGCSSCPNNP
ncbi:hypothetical protein CDCA_CDCA07G2251 [Cyanidium caldarium]|uniref:Uncharacterized protein n=1 Tax=Cyanidium caldarium TaxID=2771 RepID=A0AAV9IVP0_CYACA|nr:hypothetical protein CDCA_CDCA07G2251 [Cyanidium caldarium]